MAGKGGASAVRNATNAESEMLAMVGGSFLVALILFATLWFTGSHRIVYFTAPAFRACAWLYNLVPGGQEDWGRVNFLYDTFRHRAKDVTLFEYAYFTNLAMRPLAYFFAVVMAALIGWTFTRSANKMARRLSPALLTKILANTFTGIIPVMHLGPQLVLDKLVRWRHQTWPEEVLMEYKIGGKPLLLDGKVNLQQIQKYFQGELKMITVDGKSTFRRLSRTLGVQLVDLPRDRGKKVCYPDRMSDVGKVMYALLVAHAFGGREGKADYYRAMDELNRTCLMHPEGMPNLTVAQWIFAKYRMHEKAHALFGVHHWEYTYLYAIFFMAKRQGKVTHRQWIWLKPTNRILFYVLNTVLRKVPHIESAAVWTQFDFERQAALMERVPIAEDGTPSIITTPPEEALQAAWEHHLRAVDDDTDAWWADGSAWRRANNVVLKAPPLPPQEATHVADADGRFDREATMLREEAVTRFNAKSEDAASEYLGQGETLDDLRRAAIAGAQQERGATGRGSGAGGASTGAGAGTSGGYD